MSPELIDPQRFGLEESRRTKYSDCYALGMVIYETVSGNFPFHRYTNYTVIVKILAGERPPRGVGFAESVWKMLELCWATQPDHRPSAKDVLRCLEGLSDLVEPPPPLADVEMETGSYDRDSSDGSYGMFPHFAPLQCFAVSVRSTAIEALMADDVDSYMSFLRSRAPSALSKLVYSADNLGATERDNDPGLSSNNSFASGVRLPRIPPYPSSLPPLQSLPQPGFRRVRDASELHPIPTRPQAGRRMDGNGICLSVRTLVSASLACGAIPVLNVRLTDGIIRNCSPYDN